MKTLFSLLDAIFLTAASAECFRVLQAASYRPQRGYAKVFLSPYYLFLAAVQAVAVLLDVFVPCALYVNAGLFFATALGWGLVKRKCPLKLTKRVLRMFAAEAVILALLCALVNPSWWVWLLPVTVLAAWAICLPLDTLINRRYVRLASQKLRDSGVTVIAVTGSYGKTSVKDMLSALLNDCAAPSGSCNTPLGIAAFVNKTDLGGVRYLVLEFGARRRGDIAELCRLYPPKYGVVTGVCAQHLSTFKTFSQVIAAKRELAENLPSDGVCVLNEKDKYARSFLSAGTCGKRLSYQDTELTVEKVDFDGTTLSVLFNGERATVHLPQISDYVADTFAMCLSIAACLGQSLNEVQLNAPRVKQTPHRLQILSGATCRILDDSYNGSIVGVQSCCATLNKFSCHKAVITQGLAECGRERKRLNEMCGELLGNSCGAAVVLGKNAKYLSAGLARTNCKVLFARNLNEAVKAALPYARDGLLLFQNDLPDVAGL